MSHDRKPPVFCERYCIVCRGARNGHRFCLTIQNLEIRLFGKNGCLWGKARARYYGVGPDQPLPGKMMR